MAEQETTRLYSMLDRVSEEQRTLLTSVSALKEQVRKIEINDELQITEIGNLKLSLGTTTASMQYLTEQINEISDQRSKLMSAVDSAKESARQVASFEAVCNEKFTNIANTLEHTHKEESLRVEKLELELDMLRKSYEKLETRYNYISGVLLSSFVGFIIWVVKVFGTAKGWW